jgi:hypothetical protein
MKRGKSTLNPSDALGFGLQLQWKQHTERQDIMNVFFNDACVLLGKTKSVLKERIVPRPVIKLSTV